MRTMLYIVGLALALAGAVVVIAAAPAVADRLLDGRDVRNGSLTGADIKDRSIKPRDIGRGAVARSALAPGVVKILTETDATVKAATSVEIPSGQTGSIEVVCPEDRIAVGGGGGFVRAPHLGQIGKTMPLIDDSGSLRGWEVAGRTNSVEGDLLEVYAICVR